MNPAKIALGLLFVLTASGCNKPPPPTTAPAPQSLPTTTVIIAGRQFVLEVADEPRTQSMGLMHRDSMPGDHGMIFVFADEQPRGFWMQNTRIPLDIVYLDRGGTVVSILPMKPYDIRTVPSGKPAMYAIELNQGIAATIGLKVGDRITIPDAVKSRSE